MFCKKNNRVRSTKNNSSANTYEIIEFIKEPEEINKEIHCSSNNYGFNNRLVSEDYNYKLDNKFIPESSINGTLPYNNISPIEEIKIGKKKNDSNKFINNINPAKNYLSNTFENIKNIYSNKLESENLEKIFSPFQMELDTVLINFNTNQRKKKEVTQNINIKQNISNTLDNNNEEEIILNINNTQKKDDNEKQVSFENNIQDIENVSENDAISKIIQEKITKIKELKDYSRKCLLQENEQGLYGYSEKPEDVIKDIYKILNNDDINYYNEIGVGNDKTKWDGQQLKDPNFFNNMKFNSFINGNTNKDILDYFNKKNKKFLKFNSNEEMNNVETELNSNINNKFNEVDIINKHIYQYKDQIKNIYFINDNLKNKLECFIQQYYSLKNRLFEF